MLGGFGADGFSGCTSCVGADIDKNTSSRYFMDLKIARIIGEKKLFTQPTEYFVETSQSYTSVKPIFICHVKENHESIHFIWSWIQTIWKNSMKSFTVKFHSRDIVINFPSPKVIGDGKEFLNLLNAPRVFCYLCPILSEHAQHLKTLNKFGRKIDRNLEEIWQFNEVLMKTWKDSKTKKPFIEFFPAETQKNFCGYTTLVPNGFSFENLPTIHFKIHVFQVLKSLLYQINSRKLTKSGRSVSEIQAVRGKQKKFKSKVQNQQCEHPNYRNIFKGFSHLKTHIMRKKQPKPYFQFYNQNELLEKLKSDAKHERQFCRKTLLDHYIETVKNEFTKNIHEKLGIKVNNIKLAGHGASIENGPTTMKFLDPLTL